MKGLAVIVADFGLSVPLDEAILEAHRTGIVTITSLLVNLPGALRSLSALSHTPELGVGIHLNLTQGRPLCPPSSVPSLTAADGVFLGPVAARSGVFRPEDVEMEMEAQTEAFLATGLRPSHIDLHEHLRDPHALSMAERLSQRLRVPLHLGGGAWEHVWPLLGGGQTPRKWLQQELLTSWDGLREVGISLCTGDRAASPALAMDTVAVLSDAHLRDLVSEAEITLVDRLAADTATAVQVNEQVRTDYDRGYDAGYDAGFNRGFDQGHNLQTQTLRELGYLSFLVESTPADVALPLGYGIGDLVREAARVVQTGRAGAPFALPAEAVHRRISEAIAKNEGFSVICLDAELDSRFQEATTASPEDLRLYADVLRDADIIGLPVLHHFDRQTVALDLLFRLGLPVGSLQLTDSAIALLMHAHGLLQRLLRGDRSPRTLVLSESPNPLAEALGHQGVRISGAVAMPKDTRGAEAFVSTLDPGAFDLALVAGRAARLAVAVGIARRLGRVALDVGTLGEQMASGQLVL